MGDKAVVLSDRGIVEVAGADASDFLQSLVTNDIDRVAPGSAMFAGLLTPQGKIVFDFIIYSPGENAYWLDAPVETAAALAKRLNLYKLRAKVAVADRTQEMAVGALLEDGAAPAEPPVAVYADPRHPLMPRRFILSDPGGAARAGAGGGEAYHATRIALCVPEGARDYAYGEIFPHEVCYDLLNGVDFDKGCYVGQEVVSRMHHRGVAKTRIAGVKGTAPLPAVGTEITSGDHPVGQLGSSQGELGVALVRLDRAEEAAGRGAPLRAGGVELTLRRPDWASYDVPAVGAAA
jgi:folate-binding protein YgfZ